ncbi:hypothetical protein Cgig2_018518 [Carnegiea gigantea]|uniref:Uncharacterized protein n=1 Tax=Carnegiea gigantea TaxID=171969 RepID=A0A9Q1GKR0_9CARY|nr:hypothetical protein Cgig2_018518 [Carnegiea gigantea]
MKDLYAILIINGDGDEFFPQLGRGKRRWVWRFFSRAGKQGRDGVKFHPVLVPVPVGGLNLVPVPVSVSIPIGDGDFSPLRAGGSAGLGIPHLAAIPSLSSSILSRFFFLIDINAPIPSNVKVGQSYASAVFDGTRKISLKIPVQLILIDKWSQALLAPAKLIADNAGFDGEVIVDRVQDSDWRSGYNAMMGRFEDLIEAGVVDPCRVTRCSLQYAVSIAGLVLTTQAILVEKTRKPKPLVPHVPGIYP